jgi:glycosyltransferase involved in cell wall biosynthesis
MKTHTSSLLVSIIVPVYNGEKYIAQAIDSALSQTYKNIEIIVINDGSYDETESIVLSYGTKVRYYKKENEGVATALNFGIKKMKGEYFSWLSHDDIFLENKIELQVNKIVKHPKNTILYSNYGVFQKDISDFYVVTLPNIESENFRYWITVENCLHGCTLLIPKHAFDVYGVFDTSLKTTQDYAMWFKMAKNYQFIGMPDITVLARSHPEQGSIYLRDHVLKECDDLMVYFIDHLSPFEIADSGGGDLALGYQKIAESFLRRNFLQAYVRVNSLLGISKLTRLKKMKILYKVLKRKIRTIVFILFPVKFYIKLKCIVLKLAMRQQSKFQNNNTDLALKCINLKNKFSEVYDNNLFKGRKSRSGEGSDLVQTEIIRNELPKLIRKYAISSFLDAPCGDWYWMRALNLDVKKYIGIDIVPQLIEKNKKEFSNDVVSFQVINLVDDLIPTVDLIFSRDCLVHLCFKDAIRIIKNFKKSGSKYLLTTTFINRNSNLELDDLFWRPLNMQKPPFNFPEPLHLINEGCTEDNGNFSDKCLGLWLLDDIIL